MVYSVPKESHQERKVFSALTLSNLSNNGCDSLRWLTLTEEFKGSIHCSKQSPEETYMTFKESQKLI